MQIYLFFLASTLSTSDDCRICLIRLVGLKLDFIEVDERFVGVERPWISAQHFSKERRASSPHGHQEDL